MTTPKDGQIKIEFESDVKNSHDKIFKYYKDLRFIDCKINAFPFNTEYSRIDLEVKSRTAASFIMIDLDLKDFENNDQGGLHTHLKKTLNKLNRKFNGDAHPTVLWTGNGYHIYQPVDGIIFERYEKFFEFLPYVDTKNLTTEFLRFAEKFFTDGKSDPNHTPSIKSCLVRIPGTLNPKNGAQVKIVQKWDGKLPHIKWIFQDFKDYLIQKRIDKINLQKKQKNKRKNGLVCGTRYQWTDNKIKWIEKLLQTPIEDYRKQCLWRILCPYLINIRKLTHDESTEILKEWLQKCHGLKNLDFNPSQYITDDLKKVKEYKSHSKEKLRDECRDLYNLLKSREIID
ncbi:MAG TPA: DNA primase noncatalytic subunit PriX [Candidatus Nitrosocosmicus sp.]